MTDYIMGNWMFLSSQCLITYIRVWNICIILLYCIFASYVCQIFLQFYQFGIKSKFCTMYIGSAYLFCCRRRFLRMRSRNYELVYSTIECARSEFRLSLTKEPACWVAVSGGEGGILHIYNIIFCLFIAVVCPNNI